MKLFDRMQFVARLEAEFGGEIWASGDSALWEYSFSKDYAVRVVAAEDVELQLRDVELDLKLRSQEVAHETWKRPGWISGGSSPSKGLSSECLAGAISNMIPSIVRQAETLEGLFRSTEEELHYLWAKMIRTSEVSRFLKCYDRVLQTARGRYVLAVIREIGRSKGADLERAVHNLEAAREILG